MHVIISSICLNTITTNACDYKFYLFKHYNYECQWQLINYNTYQRTSEIPTTEKTITTL